MTVNIWKPCVNCSLKNEYQSSNEHYLGNSENKAWKKNSGLYEV